MLLIIIQNIKLQKLRIISGIEKLLLWYPVFKTGLLSGSACRGLYIVIKTSVLLLNSMNYFPPPLSGYTKTDSSHILFCLRWHLLQKFTLLTSNFPLSFPFYLFFHIVPFFSHAFFIFFSSCDIMLFPGEWEVYFYNIPRQCQCENCSFVHSFICIDNPLPPKGWASLFNNCC